MWAFQYSNGPNAGDATLARVPGGNRWDLAESGPLGGRAVAVPDPTLELTLGGYRSTTSSATARADNGGEHGNCIIHELLVFNGKLTESEMLTVTNSLRTRWGA